MSSDVILEHLFNGILRDQVCRICIGIGKDLIPLADKVEGEITLQDMLLSITSLQIEENVSMPLNVCQTCYNNIVNCYKFRIKCEDSDNQLQQSIQLFYEEIEKLSKEKETLIGNKNDGSIIIVLPSDETTTHSETKEGYVKEEMDIEKDNLLIEEESYSEIRESQTKQNMNKHFLEKLLDEASSSVNMNFDYKSENSKESCSKNSLLIQNTEMHQNQINSKHICPICSRIYNTKYSLKKHLTIHNATNIFICGFCNRSFMYKNVLKRHIFNKHLSEKYKCKICLKKFCLKSTILKHLKTEHFKEFEQQGEDLISDVRKNIDNMKTQFDCTMCDKNFALQSDLDEHKATHPSESKHICRICGKQYKSVGTLKYHMVRHSGQKNHLCTICGKSFFYKKVLKAHMIYHGKKQYGCQHCDKTYHTQFTLQEHNRISHSDEKYRFMCEECGHRCSSRKNLTIHLRGHGLKMCCPHCGKGYKNLRYFKYHLEEHERRQKNEVNNSRKYICDYCGEEKSIKSLIERHILSKHLMLRRYVCEECGKAFHTKGGLNEHGAVHKKLKLAKCDICQRKLVNNCALAIHLRLHTGQKPYSCLYCKEMFISASRRMSHIRLKHPEVAEKSKQKNI